MILNVKLSNNITIHSLNDLFILGKLEEAGTTKINKSQIARELGVDRRKDNATRLMVKLGALSFIKELKDFDFDFQSSINKQEILELETLSFIDKAHNIIFRSIQCEQNPPSNFNWYSCS